MEFSSLLSKAGRCALYAFRAHAEVDSQCSRMSLCLPVFLDKFHGEGTKILCSNQSVHNYGLTLLALPLEFNESDPPKLTTSEELR